MNATLRKTVIALAVAISSAAFISGCGQSYAERVVDVGDGTLTVTDTNSEEQKVYDVASDVAVTLNGELASLNDIDEGDAVKVVVDESEQAIEVKAVSPNAEPKVRDSEEDSYGALNGAPDAAVEESLREGLIQPSTDALIDPQPIGAATTIQPPFEIEESDEGANKAEKFEGTIVTKSDNHFVIEDSDMTTTEFNVNEDTTVTLDGNEFPFVELNEGWLVYVTANVGDDNNRTAANIEATSPK